mmetsp:Transcript_44512/g.139504  ORF Transcript_44512/g.139504 Transcript_44512/m.139504 type:complete len:693 (-) Transcript_44512:144-2222(-)
MCSLDEGVGSFCGRIDDFGQGPPCTSPATSGGPLGSGSSIRNVSFVGPGRGQYTQETTYKYVGDGTGSFDIVMDPAAKSLERCDPLQYCCVCLHPNFPLCFFPFLLSVGLLSIVLWLLLRSQQVDLDCHANGASMDEWSDARQAWCCKNRGVCPEGFVARTVPLRGPGYCQVGLATWQTSWSDDKKRWCCNHFRIGCHDSQAYNCSEDQDGESSGWPDDKKVWCCLAAGTGCEKAPAGALFDCQAGRVNWWVSWTTEKKDWCCENESIACDAPPQLDRPDAAALSPSSTEEGAIPADAKAALGIDGPAPCDAICVLRDVAASCGARMRYTAKHLFGGHEGACAKAREHVVNQCSLCSSCSPSSSKCRDKASDSYKVHPPRFNCDDGLPSHWTARKRVWCCEHGGNGCSGGRTYNCSSGDSTSQGGWPAAKRRWCCSHASVGCSNATASASREPRSYNCTAGLSDWQRRWSDDQKAWCCSHAKRGCPSGNSTDGGDGAGEPRFDCDVGHSDRVLTWSEGKKAWCCEHRSRGCTSTSGSSPPFDCKDGLDRPEKWPLGKRMWCCENARAGCQPTTSLSPGHRTSAPFDCLAAYRNWKLAWSDAKKQWCCRYRGRGCGNNPLEPYDCNNGLLDWERAWDFGKKAWCCRHHGKGCSMSPTSIPFDCLDGFEDWQTLWTERKKDWCCSHRSRGCPVV